MAKEGVIEVSGIVEELLPNAMFRVKLSNIKAKLAHLQEVPLNAEEEVFLDRMMKTQTFDEVVELAKDILKYTKENQPELLEPKEQEQDNSSTPQDSDDPTSSGHDDQEVPQQEKYEEEQSSTPGQVE